MTCYSEAIEKTYDLCDIYYDLYWCPNTTRPQGNSKKCPFATLKGKCRLEQALFKTPWRSK